MKALVYDRYGGIDTLVWRTIASVPPRGAEIRVHVRRAALNPKDALFRKGKFAMVSGRRFPKRCGLDFAGEVVDGGDFRPGQRVFGARAALS